MGRISKLSANNILTQNIQKRNTQQKQNNETTKTKLIIANKYKLNK